MKLFTYMYMSYKGLRELKMNKDGGGYSWRPGILERFAESLFTRVEG